MAHTCAEKCLPCGSVGIRAWRSTPLPSHLCSCTHAQLLIIQSRYDCKNVTDSNKTFCVVMAPVVVSAFPVLWDGPRLARARRATVTQRSQHVGAAQPRRVFVGAVGRVLPLPLPLPLPRAKYAIVRLSAGFISPEYKQSCEAVCRGRRRGGEGAGRRCVRGCRPCGGVAGSAVAAADPAPVPDVELARLGACRTLCIQWHCAA